MFLLLKDHRGAPNHWVKFSLPIMNIEDFFLIGRLPVRVLLRGMTRENNGLWDAPHSRDRVPLAYQSMLYCIGLGHHTCNAMLRELVH